MNIVIENIAFTNVALYSDNGHVANYTEGLEISYLFNIGDNQVRGTYTVNPTEYQRFKNYPISKIQSEIEFTLIKSLREGVL